MEMRELSVSETNMVSGAGQNYPRTDYFKLVQGIPEFEKQANALDSTKDWHYVAATDPVLSKHLESFLNECGFGGKATVTNWAKQYR